MTRLLALLFFVSPIFSQQKAIEQISIDSHHLDLPQPEYSLYKAFGDLDESLRGENLFQYLHKNTEIRNPINYTTSSNLMFSAIDNSECENGKTGVFAFYSLICVNGTASEGTKYKEQEDQNGDGISNDSMNVEHIWPQSFFNKNLPMRADLHHLRPTFSKPNNYRKTAPFYYVNSPFYSTNSGAKFDGEYFEPPDAVKGDVARSLFYFIVRYYNRKIKPSNYDDFFVSKIKTYLQWNRQDPPDSYEKQRNDRIYTYQGNRNPFVDDYTLADRIGEEVFISH